jgi:hypothetical protein
MKTKHFLKIMGTKIINHEELKIYHNPNFYNIIGG